MFEAGDPKELLKGKVQAFLQDFEGSEDSEEAVKTLLSMCGMSSSMEPMK
ncbi:hypothetical protein [Candidatus Neptunochlamydia vexilliferae]|nr:hypothetical protein [Candidatus Neptunochlamydia vexilliferae]